MSADKMQVFMKHTLLPLVGLRHLAPHGVTVNRFLIRMITRRLRLSCTRYTEAFVMLFHVKVLGFLQLNGFITLKIPRIGVSTQEVENNSQQGEGSI